MRASRRAQTGNSPGWKNMPSLVRAALTSLAPVVGRDRLRARQARARRARSARRIRRPRAGRRRRRRAGGVIAISTATSRSPARTTRRLGVDVAAGHRPRRGAAARRRAAVRGARAASSRARSRATASSQPLAFIASRTIVGRVAGGRLGDDPVAQLGVTSWVGRCCCSCASRANFGRSARRLRGARGRLSGSRGCG